MSGEASYLEFESREVKDFLKNVEKRLSGIENGSKEYTGLLSAIVYEDIIRHFEDEQGEGGPWQQWSASYKKQMNENGKGGNKILQDTGKLRNTFKPSKVRKTAVGFLWYNDAKVKGGFPYAFAHNEGGPKLPKRDFMWLSDKAMDKISVQTLQFMIEKGI